MSTDSGHAIWPSCEAHLLAVDDAGRLRASDAFLRSFMQRPELIPIDDSCANERALHRALLERPRRVVDDTELAALADADARENYRLALALRDLLLRHDTLESAYLALTSGRDPVPLPSILVDDLIRLIVKHLLGDHLADAYRLRTAELLFRRQLVSTETGVVVADAEYLQRHRRPPALSVLESLIRQAGGVVADGDGQPGRDPPQLELLNKYTLGRYLEHSEAHELALGLNPGEPGLEALCRVLEDWLRHFLALDSRITPLREIRDERWRWHIGLDAESNRILNRLYRGEALDEDERGRLLILFRLDLEDTRLIRPELAGYPIYLALAMNDARELRLKPQNLLLNLPLRDPV